jgi:glycosyltransferase involved in cell wall biosynthesis
MIDPARPDYTNTPVSAGRPTFGYSPSDLSALPQATIVTPFFDTGRIFHETARSVLAQSFQQWEWLIVNDGSTDAEALAVLEAYRGRDPRIRVIDHACNRGPGAARNTAFSAAQTPYVVQLDSDNLLEPTAIEKWLWYLESHPEDAFVKGFTVGFGAAHYLMRRGFHNGRAFLSDNQVDVTGAIRRGVHQAVGGYDESIREGLEDWEFWLRSANHGHWGGTVPEFLDWYRRRASHADRWADWDLGTRQERFRSCLRGRLPGLWNGGFPSIGPTSATPGDPVPVRLPFDNRLRKDRRRLLLVMPWMALGGADNFNVQLLQQLNSRGWEVTVVATLRDAHPWLPRIAELTPDIFVLSRFLRLEDYPRFLLYLIRSRQVDAVLISHSELGYRLLPFLRAYAPDVPCVDYCHLEEEYWNDGGYPRFAIDHQDSLDLTLVTSRHLERWMTRRGASRDRIRVRTINVDTEAWRPDAELREAVRRELRLQDTIGVILFAGRLCAQKQPRVLARTLLFLHQRGVSFVALIAGDGPDLAWLRRFIRRHRLRDHVRVLGAVSPSRVCELMTAADVFFLPSLWEGIACSSYEALACGVPVVGADVGGQRELVTPECGVLLPRDDERTEARRYAIVLAELLRHPERRSAMGRAGRSRVCELFPIAEMGRGMAQLLGEAIALHADRPGPVPTLDEGRMRATRVVEEFRLREALAPGATLSDPLEGVIAASTWRAQLYRTLYQWHEPMFDWYVRRGWTWIHPGRQMVKRALLRFVESR